MHDTIKQKELSKALFIFLYKQKKHPDLCSKMLRADMSVALCFYNAFPSTNITHLKTRQFGTIWPCLYFVRMVGRKVWHNFLSEPLLKYIYLELLFSSDRWSESILADRGLQMLDAPEGQDSLAAPEKNCCKSYFLSFALLTIMKFHDSIMFFI